MLKKARSTSRWLQNTNQRLAPRARTGRMVWRREVLTGAPRGLQGSAYGVWMQQGQGQRQRQVQKAEMILQQYPEQLLMMPRLQQWRHQRQAWLQPSRVNTRHRQQQQEHALVASNSSRRLRRPQPL